MKEETRWHYQKHALENHVWGTWTHKENGSVVKAEKDGVSADLKKIKPVHEEIQALAAAIGGAFTLSSQLQKSSTKIYTVTESGGIQ